MWPKTVCDRKHANKHQVKEDQTHMPLPPKEPHMQHSLLIYLWARSNACVKVLRLHMAMAKR